MVGGVHQSGVTRKANVRHHILPCITIMGLFTRCFNLAQDHDIGEISNEAKQYFSMPGLRPAFLFQNQNTAFPPIIANTHHYRISLLIK